MTRRDHVNGLPIVTEYGQLRSLECFRQQLLDHLYDMTTCRPTYTNLQRSSRPFAQCRHNRRLAGRIINAAPRAARAVHACMQLRSRSRRAVHSACAAARSRMAEGSSVAGSLHAANDNSAGDDGGSNEAGNSEVVSLMDRLRDSTT